MGIVVSSFYSRTDGRLHERVLYISQKCPCQKLCCVCLFVFTAALKRGFIFLELFPEEPLALFFSFSNGIERNI